MSDKRSMSGLATLVRSKGRGDDTMLIHMTPDEVHGLQRLALAHGGSLTINPDTGLPEAGFLKSLLPALIGFGLSFIPGVGPLAAAGIVGAGETIRTKGDLGKGLMAGLGAFGGAGLGAGLTAAGTAAGAANAATGVGGTGGGALAGFVPGGAQAAQAATQAAATEATKQGAFATMGQGAKALATEAGRNAFVGAIPGGMKGIAAGGAGLAGAMTPQQEIPGVEEIESPYWESYGYDPEQGRFLDGRWLPSYPGMPKKKKGYADGGLASLAGQSIPHSGQKIPPQDNMYPLSIAAPRTSGTGMPQHREMFSGYSANVDPFTGEERFAAGGGVGLGPVGVSNPNLSIIPQPQSTPSFEYMPIDPALAQPNSAKAGWMEFMQQNPAEQRRFIDAGYPAEFFQQNPQTFTGQRPFIPGKDEELRSAEMARLNLSPSAMPQYQSGRGSLSNYLQDLNKFITSPVAPQRSQQPTTPPPPRSNPQNPFMGMGPTDIMRRIGEGRDVGTPRGNRRQLGDEDSFGAGNYTFSGQDPVWMRDLYNQPTPFDTQNQYETPAYQPQTPAFSGIDLGVDNNPYMPSIREEEADATPPMPRIPKVNYMAPPTPFQDEEEDRVSIRGAGRGAKFAAGGIAQYAAGGKFLRGPGDGMSDDIRANIEGNQEARLADGEFVIPADVVSHLGNGSSEAGSRRLYKMMADIRKARTGRHKQAPAVKTEKFIPK